MGRRTGYSRSADTAEEAETLRRHFVEAVKVQSPDEAQDDSCRFLRIERDSAQQAFSGWTYPEITQWASHNGLTADFVSGGAMILYDFGTDTQQPYNPGDFHSDDRDAP
jgi:hypothetical protein